MIKKSSIIYFVERVLALAFTFLSGTLILRALGPTKFAYYGTVISLGMIAVTFGKLSLDEVYAKQFVSGLVGSNLTKLLILKRLFLGAIFSFALLIVVSIVTKWRANGAVILCLCLFVATESFAVKEIQAQATGQFRSLATLGFIRGAFGVMLRSIMVWMNLKSVFIFLAVSILELAVFRLGTFFISVPADNGSNPQKYIDTEHRTYLSLYNKKMLFGYLAFTILSLLYSKIDFFLGLKFLTPDELGNYFAAQRFVEVFAYLGTVLGALLLPKIASLPFIEARKFALRSSLVMGGGAMVLIAINILIVRPILPYIAGSRYTALTSTFCILSLGVLPLYAGLPIGKMLLSQGKTKYMLLGASVSIILIIICFEYSYNGLSSVNRLAGSMVTGNSVGFLVMLLATLIKFPRTSKY